MRKNLVTALTKDDFMKEKAGHSVAEAGHDVAETAITDTLDPYIESTTLTSLDQRIRRFHGELHEVTRRFLYNEQAAGFLVHKTPDHYPALMIECIKVMLSQADKTDTPRRWPSVVYRLARRARILNLLETANKAKKDEETRRLSGV